MTQLGYIIAGWVSTFGVLGAYAVLLINRGKAVSREVAEDRRRWMTTDMPEAAGAKGK